MSGLRAVGTVVLLACALEVSASCAVSSSKPGAASSSVATAQPSVAKETASAVESRGSADPKVVLTPKSGVKHVSVLSFSLVGWPKALSGSSGGGYSVVEIPDGGFYLPVKPNSEVRLARVKQASSVVWGDGAHVTKAEKLNPCDHNCPSLAVPSNARHLLVAKPGSPWALPAGIPAQFILSDLDVPGNHATDGATSTEPPK